MKCVFFDANVLFDLLDEERSGHADAFRLMEAIEQSKCRPACSWHTLSILAYIGEKVFGTSETLEIIREIVRIFTIPQTGGPEALRAFEFLATDYEDAMQISAALAVDADFLVTSDSSGFSKSPINVCTAARCAEKLIAGAGTEPGP